MEYSQNHIDSIHLPKVIKGHSKHLFVIRLDLNKWSISRNIFIEKMNKKGIGLAVHYKPLHQLSYYKSKYQFEINKFPVANLLYESIISLPIYPKLSDSSVDYIINSIIELNNLYSK